MFSTYGNVYVLILFPALNDSAVFSMMLYRMYVLSRPLLRLLLGDIGFVYPVMSMLVIGPSLPILRQRWVESAV